jgi:hypothetical protein
LKCEDCGSIAATSSSGEHGPPGCVELTTAVIALWRSDAVADRFADLPELIRELRQVDDALAAADDRLLGLGQLAGPPDQSYLAFVTYSEAHASSPSVV